MPLDIFGMCYGGDNKNAEVLRRFCLLAQNLGMLCIIRRRQVHRRLGRNRSP